MSSPTHALAPAAPAKAAPPVASAVRVPRLQRKCSCGGDCESCQKKTPKDMLQRKAVPGAPAPRSAMPPPKAPAPPAPATAPARVPSTPQPAARAEHTPGPPKAAAPAAAPPKKLEPPAPGPHTEPKTGPKSATPAVTEKKKAAEALSDVPPIVRRVLQTPGEPLDFATRTGMEARFGHSFRDVRVHTDAQAAESARAVYAHAYTVGQDIVFDSGQYQPQTTEGRHLLAHELAHTIQQQGLQKSGAPIASDTSGDYQHLEREAENVARSVMARTPSAGAPHSASRAAQPRLARADRTKPKDPGKQAEAKKDDKDNWVDVDESSELGKAGVGKISRPKSAPDLVAVQMSKPFEVPAEKGPQALTLWDAQAKAGALQAIMAPGESQVKTSTALKQERPDTDSLRSLWLLKLGWKETSAEALWKKAAAKAGVDASTSTFRPSTKAGGKTCDIDHILELQFGGNNVPANMQVLDSSPNRSSGSQISQFLRRTAFDIRSALAKEDPTTTDTKPENLAIRLRFGSVTPSTDVVDCECCKVEKAGKGLELKDEEKGGTPGTRYPMKSGAFTACVVSNKEKRLQLRGSDVPENKAASTLIPGLQLVEWEPPAGTAGMKTCADEPSGEQEAPEKDANAQGKGSAGKGKVAPKAPSHAGGKVSAELDPGSRILEKLKIKPNQAIELARDGDGHLAAPTKEPRVAFAIDYLSEGYFTRLDVGSDGNLSGAGKIMPSVPFLPKPIDIEFDKDRFVMSTQVKKPTLPIPGVEITECSIGLQIAPEFKPEGKVGFALAAGGKQVLHGKLNVSADENGIVANGDVFASIPGVDEAKGNLTLKNKEWSGGIDIKASDLEGKLKYIKSADVAIRFSEKEKMSATGNVELAIPGVTNPVIASVHYDRDGWSYRAKARFNPPRIKPVDVELEYAHGHLSGKGSTGFEFHQLSGTIDVEYHDEKFSGTGTLAIKTPRAEGSLKVEMHPRPEGNPYFTGEGKISFQVTPDLVATAGIKIDEHEKVQFTGELAFPKPIPLFKGFSGNYEFFNVSVKIPIPGANIGGVGLEAVISGALSAGYDVGPVELLDTKATASFQPLEPDPSLEMQLQSRLHIRASVHVTGSISGDIAIDAYIASVSGGLTLSATAELAGKMDAPLSAHYKDGKIEADVGFEASLALAIILALSAHVKAEAGVGFLSVSTRKDWQLAAYTYDPGLSFGMKLKKPIHYETGGDLQLPSVDDIDWTKPQINAEDAVKKAFGQQTPKEHED